MPVGLPKRLSVIALLAAGFVGYAALTLNDLLRNALPALTTLTLMWTLGVVTYPRETPRVAGWLAPVMVVVMGVASVAAATLICVTARQYAGRPDFDGLTLFGMGLVGASLVKRIQLLMDEGRSWPVFNKPSQGVEA